MARAVIARGKVRQIAEAHALLRECLAQCEDEARACLRRADEEPENERSHTAAAAGLIGRGLEILQALQKSPTGIAPRAGTRA